MKKLICILLAILFMFSFAACGNEKSDNKEDSKQSQDKNKKDDYDEDENDNDDDNKKDNNDEDESDDNDDSFKEVVAIDNDECLIKVTDIDPDSNWGYSLTVKIENKSSDNNYVFSVSNASINGVLCSSYFASNVKPGKKAIEELNLTVDELKENGIKKFTDIELTFVVSDSETYDTIFEETVHLYPYGEDKASTFVRKPKSSDNIIVDNEYVTMIATGYDIDEIWGYTVNFYLVNKTDTAVMFSTDDTYVDGYLTDPYFGNVIPAGKSAFATMSWSIETLEECGIPDVNSVSDISEIEFDLTIYNWSNYYEDYVETRVTLNP